MKSSRSSLSIGTSNSAEGVMTSAPPATFLKFRLVNKKEMAEMLGLKPGTIVKMAQQKQIPHYKPGYKTLLFDPAEVAEWLRRKHVSANPFSLRHRVKI